MSATGHACTGTFWTETLVRVPEVIDGLSTKPFDPGLVDGEKILDFKDENQVQRLSTAIFHAWWNPFPIGVIHGDPHLGNYQVFKEDGVPRASTFSIMAASGNSPRGLFKVSWTSTKASCTMMKTRSYTLMKCGVLST